MKTYFAYGSNMNIEQMSRRCPTAKLLGTGVLNDYELTFKGNPRNAVATIEPCNGAEVPIVLWSVLDGDERSFDIYEGFPSFYYKTQLKVRCGKKTMSGFAYIMTEGYDVGIPSTTYFDTIFEDYNANGIDTIAIHKIILTIY